MAEGPRELTHSRKPVCSVCIANYNGVETLPACIDSILQQEFDQPVEIIVHDDASTDRSVELLQTRYPQVRLISSDQNVGFCVSNNRLAAQAQGSYLLLLNNDAALRPGTLRTLYEHARSHRFDGILSLAQYDAESGKLLDIGSRFDPFLNPVPNLDPQRGDVGMVMGACLWIPTDLWQELGGFPEWYGSLAEDMYLCLSAWNVGYAVRVLKEAGYDHWVGRSLGGGKVRDSRLQTTFRRRALSERNKSFTMAIYYPTPLLVVVFPAHLMLLAMEGLLLSVLKRDGELWRRIYLECCRALWRERVRLVNERRSAQRNRRIGLWRFLALFTPMPYKLKMLLCHGLPEVH